MKLKLNKKTQKKIDKMIIQTIKQYGCVLVALQYDDEEFIKDCEKTNHQLYHKPVSYHIELNY